MHKRGEGEKSISRIDQNVVKIYIAFVHLSFIISFGLNIKNVSKRGWSKNIKYD